MVDSYVEREIKFNAPARAAIPDLRSVPGIAAVTDPVTADLDAEYFDTPDLRLLAAGIGLRRRRGGIDAGWHVKFQRTDEERLEAHRPLNGRHSEPPKELRDLLVAHLRREPLKQVARIRTVRRSYRLLDTTGSALAEIADDTVTADADDHQATRWREIEIELLDGDRKLLRKLDGELRRAGAKRSPITSKLVRVLGDRSPTPPVTQRVDERSTAGEVVAAYLREQAATVVEFDPKVRIDVEDAVHKMRVATRRLRSALATYRRLLDVDVTEPLRGELKWLGGVLGAVRDAEVIRGHLDRGVSEQPATLLVGPIEQRISTSLDAEYEAARRRALHELNSARYLRLLDALDRLPDAVGGRRAAKPARKVLAKEVGRSHRRMRRRLDAATTGDDIDDQRFHEVRKAAKRVRYAAESTTDIFGSRARKLAKRMEQAQETLGAHQDTVINREVLRCLAADADRNDEPSFTYGQLHALEQSRGDERLASFLTLVDHGWAKTPGWLH
jgi:CHAD domain-containing protein